MSAAQVVDSSGWLEYFTGSDRASLFAAAIEDTDNLLVPVITIYEVFKRCCANAARMMHCKSPA